VLEIKRPLKRIRTVTRATRPAREDIKTLEDKDDWSKGLYSRWEMEKLVVAPPLSPVRQGVATFRAT